MIDMRGNLIFAGMFLIIGVVLLRLLKSQTAVRGPRRWLAAMAFLCGPAFTAIFFVADVLWISPGSYTRDGDYVATLQPIMLIGLFVGGIGGAVFWFAEELAYFNAWIRDSRKAACHIGTDDVKDDEQ